MTTHISTEILQQITPSIAHQYRVVPYARHRDILQCYSEHEHSDTLLDDIAILCGHKIKITLLDTKQLEHLLSVHYQYAQQSQADIAQIDNGQNFLMNLIQEALDNQASDIHIESYEERRRIRLRIDGKLIERYDIPKVNYSSLINQIKILSGLDISERRLPQDGRMTFNKKGRKFDMRISTMPAIHGEKIVLRLLTRNDELLDIAKLGMNESQHSQYVAAIEKSHGMVLICGPTGSGKSTTLYATLRRLNNSRCNILSVEDPVEYTIDGVNQVQLKEDIGLTFGSALRTFLRQDPDIIMLGEIRDPDTAQMAIRSSLTGHLIFSTIHTNSAWGSVARLTDMGIHPYLIADSLIMCVAQRLVRTLCAECKVKVSEPLTIPDNHIIGTHYRACGCKRCYHTGYKGRKAIYELIIIDEELQQAIRNSNIVDRHTLSQKGGKSLYESGIEMLMAGETSPEEILSITN